MPRRQLRVPPKKNSELPPAPRALAASVRSPVAHTPRASVIAPSDTHLAPGTIAEPPQSLHSTAASSIFHQYALRRWWRGLRPARRSPPEGKERASVDTWPSAALAGSTAVPMVAAPPD